MFVRTNGLLEPACEQALHLGKRSEPRENARTCFTRSNRRACSKAILNQPASKLSIWGSRENSRESSTRKETRVRKAGARGGRTLVCVLNSLHPPSFCMGILFECTALGINLYKTSRIYNVKTRLCSTDNAFRLFPSETLKTSRCFLLPNRITLR